MSGKLYVVGTPIGNLEDFSPRGVRILSEVDFIAAEDTRVTVKLLNHFSIKKDLVSYFEHNKREKGEYIINRLKNGESCAVVSDAGMPAISDPGEDLVRLAHQNGIAVESVPGPSAFVTALSIAGRPTGRFCFEGFLPVDKKQRRERFEELKGERRTMIFYEAPHKLTVTLDDFYKNFGEREISLVKELTKLHETVFNTTLSKAIEYYNQNPPKGEFVIILSGAKEQQKEAYTLEDAVAMAKALMKNGQSASFAAKEAAAATGLKKGEIYKGII
ncbi:MAG: 16S rRNA (cytidine(1402)-2'-O)-methyltransferase [Ruminococcaceae bacterium]|nr:16S rRNA (cytidine(1402)-2'-O)-methyltransferase [Oscillospiraceae bacterium]